MFLSCIWCLHVFQVSSKVSGLQENGDNKHTFMFTWIIRCSIMLVRSCVVLGCSPEAARAPTSRRTRAFTAILQQHRVLTGHKTSGYTCIEEQTAMGGTLLLWVLSMWVFRQSCSFEDSWSDCLSYHLILRELLGTTEDNVLWKTALVFCKPLILPH